MQNNHGIEVKVPILLFPKSWRGSSAAIKNWIAARLRALKSQLNLKTCGNSTQTSPHGENQLQRTWFWGCTRPETIVSPLNGSQPDSRRPLRQELIPHSYHRIYRRPGLTTEIPATCCFSGKVGKRSKSQQALFRIQPNVFKEKVLNHGIIRKIFFFFSLIGFFPGVLHVVLWGILSIWLLRRSLLNGSMSHRFLRMWWQRIWKLDANWRGDSMSHRFLSIRCDGNWFENWMNI